MPKTVTELTEAAQACFRDAEKCLDPQLAKELQDLGRQYLALAADLRRVLDDGDKFD